MPTVPFGGFLGQSDRQTASETVRVYNASETETIPGWSCLEIVSYDQINDYFVVRQPTISNRNDLLFSTSIPIGPLSEGQGRKGYPALVSYRRYAVDPLPGQVWGSVAGAWELRPSATGFVVLDVASGIENQGTYLSPARGVLLVGPATSVLMDWIRITSLTAGSVQPDYYPGVITRFDPRTDAYVDTARDVWWRETNGGAPTSLTIPIWSAHQGNAGQDDTTLVRPVYVATLEPATAAVCVDNYTRHVDYSEYPSSGDFPFQLSYNFTNNPAVTPRVEFGSGPVVIDQFAVEVPRDKQGMIFASMVNGVLNIGGTLIAYGALVSVLSVWLGYGDNPCTITWVSAIGGYLPLFRGRVDGAGTHFFGDIDTAEDPRGQLEGSAALNVWWDPTRIPSAWGVPANKRLWVTLAFEIEQYTAINTGSAYGMTVLVEEGGYGGSSLYFLRTVDGGCSVYPGSMSCGSGSGSGSACCTEAGSVDLGLPAGGDAGTHEMIKSGDNWGYQPTGLKRSWILSCAGGVYTLTSPGGASATALTTACGPLALTFDGAAFPTVGSGTITVVPH